VNVKVDLDRDLYYAGETLTATISGTKLDGQILASDSFFSYQAIVKNSIIFYKLLVWSG
jgi:hypothetical protein